MTAIIYHAELSGDIIGLMINPIQDVCHEVDYDRLIHRRGQSCYPLDGVGRRLVGGGSMRGVGRGGGQKGGERTGGRYNGGRGGREEGGTVLYSTHITIHSTFNTASVHDSPVVGCLSRQRLH